MSYLSAWKVFTDVSEEPAAFVLKKEKIPPP
jgi:hypothetical protein